MKVLLVAPPRPLWPYINEQDNFLLPQSLAFLAGALRDAGVAVQVIDCLPEHMGWATLARRVREIAPDVVAAGENHALFAGEVVRLMRVVKQIDPRIVTVAGGAHFTNTLDLYLPHEPIDLVVRGEGEVTLVEAVRALEGGGLEAVRASELPGLAFLREGRVHVTPPRPLLEDLDSLPMPALDLLPMAAYGRARLLFSPGGVTIHHSRGCTSACRFCTWWRQMAERRPGQGAPDACHEQLLPRWRTKSVARTLAEVELLVERYGRKGLVFVDPTFNVDSRWSGAFAEALLARGWHDLRWFGFFRADGVLRDERAGVLGPLVRSGLAHVCIGVERVDPAQLAAWNKRGASADVAEQAFAILRQRYPRVFRQATFIVGTRDETPAGLAAQLAFARRIGVDYPAFHPVTPFPGTELYDEARAKGWLEVTDFTQYDLMTPVMRSETMTRPEIEAAIADLNRRAVTPAWLARGLLSRDPYRRALYAWFLLVTARVFWSTLKERANPFSAEPYTSSVLPDWYEQ